MRRFAVLFLLLPGFLVLSGCFVPAPDAGRAVSFVHTGLRGVSSDVMVARRGPHHVIRARANIIRRGADTVYAVTLSQAWDGVHGRIRIESAWWRGHALPFKRAKRGARACGPTGCRDHRLGYLFLSRAMFERAAQRGYSAHLLGVNQALDVSVPARVFQQALTRARGSGLTGPPAPAS